MCGIISLQFGDGAKSFEQFTTFGGVGAAVGIGPEFLKGACVHAGVLADVERVQVKAEGANLAQQGIDVGAGQAFSTVGLETVLHEQKISLELGSVAVGGGSVHGLTALLEFVKHVGKKAAITFRRVVRSPSQMHAGYGPLVILQARQQFFGNSGLPAGRTIPIAEATTVIEIFALNQRSR